MSPFRLVLGVLAVAAFAGDVGVDRLLKGVETRYNRATTLQVLFHEEYTPPGPGDAPARRSESGLLDLRKPGRMRWEYSEPKGKLAKAIETTFGNFQAFRGEVEKAGLGRFGSGWAWLSKKADGSLMVHSTPNQDSPLSEGLFPVLGVDVWEHAYYLKYQNRRADYLTNWWNVVNWEEVERRFAEGH